MTAPHASLCGVTRRFDGPPPVQALGPLDLDLAPGEFFAVVGPSGCGKSTLLDIAAGLSRPTDGSVRFEGHDLDGQVPEGIGVVFQEDSSFAWLTVRDNVAFGLRRSGLSRAEITRRVDHAVGFMGLAQFASHHPAQLSGGMRQRVCIARTLVQQPRLILLDEPFGALDQQTRLLMGDELLRLWRETGATILLITHALDEAAMLSDRVGVMSARPRPLHRPGRDRLAPRPRQPHRLRPGVRDAHRPALDLAAHRIAENPRPRRMTRRPRAVLFTRLALLAGALLLLEALCRIGVIDPMAVIPPSAMLASMLDQIASGAITDPALQTFSTIAAAFVLALAIGTVLGAALHALPRLRRTADPLLASYYAVPTFIFYPLLVAMLGLGPAPLVVLGVLSATPAVIISTLAGLDGVSPVLRRVARVQRLGRLETLWRVVLPAALPGLFSGFKLALSYALIGVIAGEFILSGSGLGYAISFAYQSFDTRAMYGLMTFVLLVAIGANALLYTAEARLARRRARG